MFNEIYPYKLKPEFINKKPISELDFICIFYKETLLFKKESNNYRLCNLADIRDIFNNEFILNSGLYALSVENTLDTNEYFDFYILFTKEIDFSNINLAEYNLEFISLKFLRSFEPRYLAFAASTVSHIYRWQASRIFCGCCGSKNIFSKDERALLCPNCGQIEYPRINPAVIVAIRNGDKILLTKDKHGLYPNYALVAGYMEIGEDPIDTVIREVKEEVGLNIKNIRPYKTQPWGFSNALMLAFSADLDGDDTIRIQESELKEARWFKREDVPVLENHISVGQEMIEKFKRGLL